MLKARNNPEIKPIIVVLEKIFPKNNFKSFIDRIITPIVEIIMPLIPSLLSFSFNIKYSNTATWITSVLLREVPTTKFENLNKYKSTNVNITWKIEAKVTLSRKPGWLTISPKIIISLKYNKNNKIPKGRANENLTYVEAIVDTSLLIFFWKDDLKFWKKAAITDTIIQFIIYN